MSKFEEVDASLPQNYEVKDRDSNSTLAPQNECYESCSETILKTMTFQFDARMLMFSDYKPTQNISQKLIQKTLSWIQVIGYLKGLQFQTIVSSISLFYASLYKLNPTKNQIQSLICACIFLGSKMTSRVKFTLKDILSLVNNRQIPQNILKQEQKILSLFDFNLHLEIPIIQLINSPTISQQQSEKLKFLTEMVLLKDPSALYNFDLIEQLYSISSSQNMFKTHFKHKQSYRKIQKIVKKNNFQHLLNKYNSKFNVNSFIQSNVDNVIVQCI